MISVYERTPPGRTDDDALAYERSPASSKLPEDMQWVRRSDI